MNAFHTFEKGIVIDLFGGKLPSICRRRVNPPPGGILLKNVYKLSFFSLNEVTDMSYNKPKILLIDDDHDACELMPLLIGLESARYEVTACETLTAARNLLAAEKFDLLILDYMLPEMTGAQFCKEIRTSDTVTPIMFYSAVGPIRCQKEAIKAGADLFLIKPNDIDKICPSIRELLERCPIVSAQNHAAAH
jgi:CheY-like chemotaxis protein